MSSLVNKGKNADEKAKIKRRNDWEYHHELVYSAFIKIATEKKRYPKLKEIAESTGISIKTIHQHLEEMDFEELKKKYSIFTEAALFKLATMAASGKSKDWVELFFRIVHGVGDKKSLDITTKGKSINGLDLSNLSDEELNNLLMIKNKINAE